MKKLVFVFVALILNTNIFATHNLAGDISYRHISGYTYLFTVRTFCDASSMAANRCSLMLKIDNDSIVLHRINGTSTMCASPDFDGEIICADKKYNLYEGYYTFMGSGTYQFSMEDPNKSAGICNVQNGNSVNATFILSGTININSFIGTNDSPQYQSPPFIPNNVGVASIYNPNVINSEGDSLYFDFVLASGVTFPPASSAININHQTGEITWDSPTVICNYIFDVILKEYRVVGSTSFYIGYTLQEIFTSDCSINLSVNQNNAVEQTSVFPNPNEGKFEIKTIMNKIESIKIINVLGETVYNQQPITNNQQLTIDMSGNSKGIYFLQVTDENKNITNKKIVLQ